MSDYLQRNSPSQSVAFNDQERMDKPKITAVKAESGNLALAIAEAALERKAGELLVLKVADVSYLADYFLMMTGYSRVQVRAIVDAIEDKIKTECQRIPLRTEGKMEGHWVLQDYGDVIVHIMMPKEREFYNLEAFWGHAQQVKLQINNSGI
ncbi:Iojap protein [Richelia intracellularis HH01]|uniref:Ribosomal silencing factor RsfS n=1 Tax=Richelia intracellularis HH01 TaxID=1165094 RepID=M1X668_9NOST|nr:ribosome silencing factor [Richelia intracellularis]CCH67931.1 Iojap protein [Richelia intracellularis HH01]